MRFMIIVKSTEETEAGVPPNRDFAAAMRAYNDQLTKAGVLLATEGLQPSSTGARLSYSDDEPTIVDGPFTETKELIAGFWLIQVKSREEAIQWALRIPHLPDSEGFEIRQVFERTDFPEDVAEVIWG